ncbi:MAG: ribosome maturation factor RimP [Rickettsiales bacterium]|nr:ribosome maturation factor RimP [Rickettsiales bacterium]
MIEDKIKSLIEPSLKSEGYKLVNVKFGTMVGKNKALQIFAERQDYSNLSVGDCQNISRLTSNILDAEDIIKDRYLLEVSSPGLDREIATEEDFKRFENFIINLKTKLKIDESRRFKGRYKISQNGISVICEDSKKEFFVEFSNIDSAKIAITYELLKTKGVIN